jgi:hypothetical protein
MSLKDKDKLAAGALAIRKAERERDGTLAGVTKEIVRLHGEVFATAKTTLQKAIRIGELLSRVRSSRKGKWLVWLKESVPFSDQTARNYVRVYEHRDDPKFKTVLNPSDAYALLCTPKSANLAGLGDHKPKRRSEAAEQLVSRGIAKDARAAREMLRKRKEEPNPEKPKPEPDSKPELPAPKGWTPPLLEESDLTDEELGVVRHVREYLASTPKGRCEGFLRYVRENLECGA